MDLVLAKCIRHQSSDPLKGEALSLDLLVLTPGPTAVQRTDIPDFGMGTILLGTQGQPYVDPTRIVNGYLSTYAGGHRGYCGKDGYGIRPGYAVILGPDVVDLVPSSLHAG
jgi:hypothetical protein